MKIQSLTPTAPSKKSELLECTLVLALPDYLKNQVSRL